MLSARTEWPGFLEVLFVSLAHQGVHTFDVFYADSRLRRPPGTRVQIHRTSSGRSQRTGVRRAIEADFLEKV